MALIKRLGCSKLTEISMVGQRRTASSPSSFIVALACLYDMCMHVLCTPCDIYIIRHCIYIYTLLGPTKAFAPLLQHQVSQTCGWQHPHGRCQRMECPLAKKNMVTTYHYSPSFNSQSRGQSNFGLAGRLCTQLRGELWEAAARMDFAEGPVVLCHD